MMSFGTEVFAEIERSFSRIWPGEKKYDKIMCKGR